MAADPTYPFVLHGARDRELSMTGWLPHIKEQVSAIEQAVAEQSPSPSSRCPAARASLAFDFAKTLVESILRATLDEHSVGYSHNDDLPRLNKLVTQNLPLLPPGASHATGVRESLRKTTGGLASTVQGIAELRKRVRTRLPWFRRTTTETGSCADPGCRTSSLLRTYHYCHPGLVTQPEYVRASGRQPEVSLLLSRVLPNYGTRADSPPMVPANHDRNWKLRRPWLPYKLLMRL